MTTTVPEVRWLGAGTTRRKSMEPYIKDSVVYYAHQIEAIRKLAKTPPSFILADDMGLGKSLQALTIFGIDVARGFCKQAIVVCPSSLKGNWEDEIEKFTGFNFYKLQGTPKQREAQLEEFAALPTPRILIVNYEQVIPHLVRLNQFRFDVAIFDEAHYLKNHKAKRTKASHQLFSRRSMLLTGTPLLNRVNELWSCCIALTPSTSAWTWNFTHRFCLFGGFNGKEVVGTKNEAELKSYLSKYMVRRLKRDVLDLPEVQVIERRVDLLPQQRILYDEVINDLKLTVVDEDKPQDVENALTKFLRLKQICGTTEPFSGEDHSSKLDLAIEDAMEIIGQGDKVVVFTQFRSVQKCYADRMRAHGIPVWDLHGDVPTDRRSEIVKEWGSHPGPGVICCMLQVAGVGLNMTQASHAQFLDKLFVPGLNQQAVDRLHRIGASETRSVQVLEYICRSTIENRINYILRIKQKLEAYIIGTGDDADFKKKIIAAMKEELDG